MRFNAAGSPKRMTPAMAAPTAPVPVHTAYPVPTGRVRSATASRTMLRISVTTNSTVGPAFENPSDCLSASAQIVSNRPAMKSTTQVTTHLQDESMEARRLGFPGTARVSSGLMHLSP
jgi:hypothetical protein